VKLEPRQAGHRPAVGLRCRGADRCRSAGCHFHVCPRVERRHPISASWRSGGSAVGVLPAGAATRGC